MATDDERREVASHMRVLAGTALVTVPLLSEVISAGFNCDANIWQRLADLIEPTCEARKSTLFYPASSSVPEYEETVYRCGRCGEIASYDEDYDPETDLPAYCMRCGSLITGIGEPWDE